MAKSNGKQSPKVEPEALALSRITVAGFKSIGPERSIEIRPLTILAGANSSGKSSIMQPLLLLKQTLEAPYDPGALLLDGPNVRFTNFEQMLFNPGKKTGTAGFTVGTSLDGFSVAVRFCRQAQLIDVESMTTSRNGTTTVWHPGISEFDPTSWAFVPKGFLESVTQKGYSLHTKVVRERCFLKRLAIWEHGTGHESPAPMSQDYASHHEEAIVDLIHLPGLRGNPRRTYPRTALGQRFAGTFNDYFASIIARATADESATLLKQIGDDLQVVGLTWKVIASAIDDTQVEVRVGRLPHPTQGGAHDLVNIADVGFGVSQVLPVVVALRVAKPGQLVYIEQPEIHLHPRAQVAMARLLVDAANRGVRVVAETHSSLVLLGVQSLVAEGVLALDKVKLHWFRRNEKTGATDITSADLDRSGAYGEWPEDFADVELASQHRYTQAAFEQLKAENHGKKSSVQARN